MPEIEIRTAIPEDTEALSSFEHGYYSDYAWQMGLDVSQDSAQVDFRRIRLPRRIFVAYPRSREEIFSTINQNAEMLIAVLQGNPVGYIKTLQSRNSKVARVLDLVVSSPMRRQGIGRALVLAMMDYLRHQSYHTLMLQMQSKNDPAIRMAEKLGFGFCGFQDHFFPNNEVAIFFSRIIR